MGARLNRRQSFAGAGAAAWLSWLGAATAAPAAAAPAAPTAPGATTSVEGLPAAKATRAGLYLQAHEVPSFIARHGGAQKVLFVDVRTRAEAMYVGMAEGIDALVPFVEHQELMTDWDAQRHMYRLEPLQDFVPELNRRREQKHLGKHDVVVLICRSGDRSSRAANRLQDDGYTRVWTVVDGLEGDMSPQGRRSLNGWKNAGLPWTYRLERERMYFPR